MEKRVLIIDENVENRRELRKQLSADGWQVEDSRDGMGALEAIQLKRSYGQGFHCIVSELFLPDIDGILLIKTLRQQYPELPLVVVTRYGNEQVQADVEALGGTIYRDKQVDMAELVETMASIELQVDTSVAATPPEPTGYEDNIGAYIYLRINSGERVDETYESVRHMEGIFSTNAVRGDFDMVLRVAVPTMERLNEMIELLSKKDGVELHGYEQIIEAHLSASTADFNQHFQTVWTEVNKDYVAGQETNAYLMIDVDRYQLERIYTSIRLTEGVFRCRVIHGGSKLMVLMSGAVRPGVVRHLLRKLAVMDGILRVREATVINLHQ